ncbi:hypothetical protein [Sinorhizobium meliloti]|uniref:hypothetical protein n=1 Tax=Rhizobium meliloti TaxID=382 RepID=UPI000FD7841F|nr:hypothetical protein [Sinorhizobium meliloti]RVL37992.1 hypothetical protein CN148_11770 [Sinorhizobium meliloti]
MLIKVLVSMSGPSETYTGGQVYEVADERAARLIARGAAEAVEETALAAEPGVATEPDMIAETPAPTPKRGRRK